MNLSNRIQKMEARCIVTLPQVEYSREEIAAMSLEELHRATREVLSAPLPNLTPKERERQREYSAYLGTLPNDEIVRLTREKLGDVAEIARRW